MSTYLPPPGAAASMSDLTAPKAVELARLLNQERIEFAAFVGCAREEGIDTVIFDVEVELGQVLVHPIQRRERVAACFDRADEHMPETLSLRSDFPSVPHLNLSVQEGPRSFCLYNQPYRELKSHWTAPRYVERIRTWLALTAKGKLHTDDQPLEPLLWGCAGQIVLPASVLRGAHGGNPLSVSATSLRPGHYFFIAEETAPRPPVPGVPHVTLFVACPPQQHGLIRYRPTTLRALAEFASPAGFDFLAALRQAIESAKHHVDGDPLGTKRFLDAPLVLLVAFPKSRHAGNEPESTDIWAFLTTSSLRDIGVDIGLWTIIGRSPGREPTPPPGKTGSNIPIELLNPIVRPSHGRAHLLSDSATDNHDRALVAVGAGAIGSQLILNLARGGYGRWTIVDDDRLLPHNVARHALGGDAIGWPKAETLAITANGLFDGEPRFSFLNTDVLRPGDAAATLAQALREAEAVVDLSASVPVARYLARDADSPTRRVSLFLNPSGQDLVILAEDSSRHLRLDQIEMQYYRALIQHPDLQGHFQTSTSSQRYGQSCRDISARIPQDLVALHAAIGSRALRTALASDGPQISVWRAAADLTVQRVDIEVSRTVEFTVADWTIRLDHQLLDTLHDLRTAKLPRETGGVLIGSLDMERRVTYLLDTIPSPPDSDEWPTLYIRGCRGLKQNVERVMAATDGMLHYVGEWHSHPAGSSTAPSDDDMKVFCWLTEVLDAEGFPAMMMIVGDVGNVSCFHGTISHAENLIPRNRP